jgi:AcrR family transcriptional regulator
MTKTVGRPRSQAADDSIIKAATKMFYKQPYQDVSMEAIAGEAGVSKATLYRRWPNKSMLAVEVLINVVLAEKLTFEGGSYREHLIQNLKALRNMLASDYSDVIVSIIAETQHDKILRDLFYKHFLLPVQAIGDADLERAIAMGEVKAIIDKDMVFDQMFGFFYYRFLVAHRPITDAEITLIVDGFLAVAGAK